MALPLARGDEPARRALTVAVGEVVVRQPREIPAAPMPVLISALSMKLDPLGSNIKTKNPKYS